MSRQTTIARTASHYLPASVRAKLRPDWWPPAWWPPGGNYLKLSLWLRRLVIHEDEHLIASIVKRVVYFHFFHIYCSLNSKFWHVAFVPLVGETRNVIFRPLNAECRLFDVDMLTPLNWILWQLDTVVAKTVSTMCCCIQILFHVPTAYIATGYWR